MNHSSVCQCCSGNDVEVVYVAAPKFIKKLPISSEVREGDDLTVECKVDEADPGDVLKHVHIKRKGQRPV